MSAADTLPRSRAHRCTAGAAGDYRRTLAALGMAAVLVIAFALAGCTAVSNTVGEPSCRTVTIPVTLPTQSTTTPAAHLSGWYCQPAGAPATTVLLAVHGGTYNHDYWDWDQQPAIYNFEDKAVSAGYAVLAIDRLGDGASTRPPSAADTADAQVATLHQTVQAIRAGRLGVGYRQVLWVGHSFGSYYGVAVAAKYPHDLDGLLLTGFGAHTSAELAQINKTDMVPANYLPRFRGLDPGYVTNKPGTRANQLADGPHHAPPHEAPEVIAHDAATEDVLATTELTTRPANLSAMMAGLPNIPVLVMDGNADEHYCAADVYDCSSTGAWFQAEASSFPSSTCLAGQLEPSGHDLQLSLAARAADTAMLSWATTSVPPRGAARCAVRGPVATAGIPMR
jgi:pimeloyl-ACP methyl ester carboxylesterase